MMKRHCLQILATDKACTQEVLLGWPELQSISPEHSRVIQTCINCIHFKLCYPCSHDDYCPFIYQWALEEGCLHRCGLELPFSRIGVGTRRELPSCRLAASAQGRVLRKHCGTGKSTWWLKAPEALGEPDFKPQHMPNKS